MDYHTQSAMALANSTALFLVLVLMYLTAFVVAFLRPDHRFQRVLAPLTRRLGATSGLLLFSGAAFIVPDLGLPYLIASSAFLCWYWWGFISQHLLALDAPARHQASPIEADSAMSDAEPHY